MFLMYYHSMACTEEFEGRLMAALKQSSNLKRNLSREEMYSKALELGVYQVSNRKPAAYHVGAALLQVHACKLQV